MGELHLEIIIDRLLSEFRVEANVGKPQVAYKETISSSARGEGKYIKQTGGHGQYGHVILEIKPLAAGKGFEFEDRTTGGCIPKEFMPAITSGIQSPWKVVFAGCLWLISGHHCGRILSQKILRNGYKIAGAMA